MKLQPYSPDLTKSLFSIQIRDVITQDVSVFCGNKNPFTWISEGNEVIVKFQTDDENRFQGYRATFRALEKEIFSCKYFVEKKTIMRVIGGSGRLSIYFPCILPQWTRFVTHLTPELCVLIGVFSSYLRVWVFPFGVSFNV